MSTAVFRSITTSSIAIAITASYGSRRVVSGLVLSACAAMGWPGNARANLLVNGGFEAAAGYAVGAQGAMPPGWTVTSVTPDLYSTDASFGLNPAVLGNFTGVSAYSGLGWVAGWDLPPSINESFAQQLASPLVAGLQYQISAHLIQAKRSDLDNPGAYKIYLGGNNAIVGAVQVASWAPTTDANDWEFRTVSFAAPADANARQWLIFQPYGPNAYPGLDNVVLNAVPEPAAAHVLALGLVLGIAAFNMRQRRPWHERARRDGGWAVSFRHSSQQCEVSAGR